VPKPPNLIPSKQLNVALPLPVFTQLTLHLHSDLEQRVPHGAYSRFITELLREHFASKVVDIGVRQDPPLTPGVYLLRGEPATIELLQRTLP